MGIGNCNLKWLSFWVSLAERIPFKLPHGCGLKWQLRVVGGRCELCAFNSSRSFHLVEVDNLLLELIFACVENKLCNGK